MSKSFKKHIISINSKDNLTNDPSNAVYNFDNNDLHETFKVQLKDVSIVNLLNNVEVGRNNILDYDANGVPKQIIIPENYYTASTLASAINNLQTDFTITFSSVSFKYSVASALPTFFKISSTIKDVIGLTATTAPSNAYTLQSIVNLVRTNYIHILSNLASLDALYTSDKKRLPIIASIPVLLPYGFVNNFQETLDSPDEDIKKANVNLSDVDIVMLDDDFKPLNLNGGKYTISFTVWKR